MAVSYLSRRAGPRLLLIFLFLLLRIPWHFCIRADKGLFAFMTEVLKLLLNKREAPAMSPSNSAENIIGEITLIAHT